MKVSINANKEDKLPTVGSIIKITDKESTIVGIYIGSTMSVHGVVVLRASNVPSGHKISYDIFPEWSYFRGSVTISND